MPIWHILSGGIFSLIILFFFNLNLFELIILFLSTWLFIDLDLVISFVIKNRSLNLRKFWKESTQSREKWLELGDRSKYKRQYRIFHSIEFLSIIVLLSFFNKIFLLVLLGFLVHLIFDWIELGYKGEDIFSKVSLYLTYQRNKNKKDLPL